MKLEVALPFAEADVHLEVDWEALGSEFAEADSDAQSDFLARAFTQLAELPVQLQYIAGSLGDFDSSVRHEVKNALEILIERIEEDRCCF